MNNKYFKHILFLGCVFFIFSCKRQTLNNENSFDVSYNDTLEYNLVTMDTTDAFCISKYKNCPNTKLSYIVFISKDTELNAYLNTEVTNMLLYNTDTTVFPSIAAYIDNYFADNRTMKSEGNDDDEMSAWENEKTITPLQRVGNYITIESNQYSYQGGAHPNSYTIFKTYDITQKRLLKLDELLNINDKALLKIGENYFRKENDIADSTSLEDSGFFIFGEGNDFEESEAYGKFQFNDNFALTKNGIQFYYNSYEIGSYAVGAPSFTIPYTDLQPFLKLKIW